MPETNGNVDHPPRVLDVGNCDPDHAAIRRLLARFNAEVDRATLIDEAWAELERRHYDLVLVNRLIFADSSDGLALIERMRSDDRFRDVPVMMVSNFDDAQARAVAAGARRGFGKAELHDARTLEGLEPLLRKQPADSSADAGP
jgi:PleD family two-component response regulator